MAEVQETLKRLQSQKGIQGIIVMNTEGIPIKSTMDNPTTTQYAKPHAQLHIEGPEHPAKMKLWLHQIKDYFLIVIQNPTE
ncbi:unnamed protein product [Nyctereutes procyonoides]|uniref:(raccoon dog) hypothetical protein n=1 Tax=Nyctereutes procyonoides TaxID=34880 RepID=A0A811YF62_NYCPR|nr:unnamed protein product [Nyctereutes procyonoides]